MSSASHCGACGQSCAAACIDGECWNTVPGGILKADTVWDLAGSPYRLGGNIQVATDTTLTVDPGVVILGEGKSIEVWGTFAVAGTPGSLAQLSDVYVNAQDGGFIDIHHAHMKRGQYYWGRGNGRLTLQDSVLESTEFAYIWYPSGDCDIERNVFVNAGGLSIGTDASVQVYVRNNVFYQQTTPYAVENWASYETSMTWTLYNTFLSTDRTALVLPSGYDGAKMSGNENYWNTSDAGAIDAMIYDKNDDLGSAGFIAYQPFLLAPHTSTPNPAPWLP